MTKQQIWNDMPSGIYWICRHCRFQISWIYEWKVSNVCHPCVANTECISHTSGIDSSGIPSNRLLWVPA